MRYRVARGWSQVDLARELGVARRTVQNWERERVPPGKVGRVAEILGVPLEELREPVPEGPDAEVGRLVKKHGLRAVLNAVARAVDA